MTHLWTNRHFSVIRSWWSSNAFHRVISTNKWQKKGEKYNFYQTAAHLERIMWKIWQVELPNQFMKKNVRRNLDNSPLPFIGNLLKTSRLCFWEIKWDICQYKFTGRYFHSYIYSWCIIHWKSCQELNKSTGRINFRVTKGTMKDHISWSNCLNLCIVWC